MEKWIKISEQLPTTDDEVLALFVGWDDMKCQRVLMYEPLWFCWSDWQGLEYKTVTHWQHLPEEPN